MKIAYIRRGNPAHPRCRKECNSLVRAGHDVTYVGWDYTAKDSRVHEMDPRVQLRLCTVQSGYGDANLWKWLQWYVFLLRTIGFRRFDALHCVDEYPVLMMLPGKRLLYRWMV